MLYGRNPIEKPDDLIGGKAQLRLDKMVGMKIPGDWNITQPLHDIIVAVMVDENEFGEVMRDGIYIKTEMSSKLWRVAKVTQLGTACSGNVKVGDCVMYPSDRGIPMVGLDGTKYVFLNEERIFAIVEKNVDVKSIFDIPLPKQAAIDMSGMFTVPADGNVGNNL